MSSRKIIIPKGLVENRNQNSIIEVSSRLNQTTGNLIAKRQGKKLVAQQLPEWHDALSSPGGSVPENSFFATSAGCQPPSAATSRASPSRPNETFQSAEERTRDTTFYSATSNRDEYQSALSHNPDETYTKSCYKTPLEEASSRAYLDYTSNDASMNSTIESNIQMSDAMLANVVNETRTNLPSPKSRLGDVRQRLFTSGSSGSPNEERSARLNFTRDRSFLDSSMNQTYAAPNRQKDAKIPSSSCSTCQTGQVHALSKTYTRGQPQLEQSLQAFSSPGDSRGSRGERDARRTNQTFPQSYSEDVHSPCTRRKSPAAVRKRLFDSADESADFQSPGRTFTKAANQTFDVSKIRECFCPENPPSPGHYENFQPGFVSSPQKPNQTFQRPSANVPTANQTFVRPASGFGGATCNNQTFARPNLQGTYDANYPSFSTLEDSDAYVPTSHQTVPRAKPRAGRPRRGEDTYPRSFNRSNIEDGTYMDSDDYWPESSSGSYLQQSRSPARQLEETVTDYPTDESYGMRFHPLLASTQRSISELEDSSEGVMCGFGPGNRSDEGKYNIITPMTPSPKKTPVKDCSCAAEGSESLVSFSSKVVEDAYEE